jgi:hypothetical protein
MTRDDIIRLAQEAGFIRVVAIEEGGAVTTTVAPIEELERFAALVAAAERERYEREVRALQFQVDELKYECLNLRARGEEK